jgi:hypothetical protein
MLKFGDDDKGITPLLVDHYALCLSRVGFDRPKDHNAREGKILA